MATRAGSKVTTDHDEIRRWAEARQARPATVARTHRGGDAGIIRLDFPGYAGGDALEEISWDEWFRKFDEGNLALVYQETTARGVPSNFNKLVSRDAGRAKARRPTNRPATARKPAKKVAKRPAKTAASRRPPAKQRAAPKRATGRLRTATGQVAAKSSRKPRSAKAGGTGTRKTSRRAKP